MPVCSFFFGASFDDALSGKIRVTVLATLASPDDATEVIDTKPINHQRHQDKHLNNEVNISDHLMIKRRKRQADG